jgi:sigma-B regulation protein RsbU (phosphoserine phosphatase)
VLFGLLRRKALIRKARVARGARGTPSAKSRHVDVALKNEGRSLGLARTLWFRSGCGAAVASGRRRFRRVPLSRKVLLVEIAAVSALVAFLLSGSRGAAIDTFGGRADIAVTLLAVAAVLVPFTLLNRRVRIIVERRLHGEPYDAQRVLAELGRVLHSADGNSHMLAPVVANIRDALRTGHVAVFLEHETSGDFLCELAWPARPGDEERLVLPGDAFSVRRLARLSMPLGIDAQDFAAWERAVGPGDLPAWSSRRREAHTLRALGTKLLVQVRAHGHLIGIISLGERPSRLGFTEEDKCMLAAAASQMAFAIENAKLVRHLADEERLRAELAMATQVQERLFPSQLPALRGAELSAVCHPARGVGGDYYDFLELGPGRLGVAVADVAGKGISAALLMSVVQASLRSQAPLTGGDLTQLVSSMNRLLHQSTGSSSYATFFYAEYDEETRRLTYVNAGHNPPILARAHAEVGEDSTSLEDSAAWGEAPRIELLDAGGLAIGLFAESEYTQASIAMNPGDALILYTDGVTEAMNLYDEEFGESRLREVVARWSHASADELRERIVEAVRAWCGSAPQHDDLTLSVLKVAADYPLPGVACQSGYDHSELHLATGD